MLTTGGVIPASDGEKIVLLVNLVPNGKSRGTVLIVPPFGKSAKDLFIFAYYLWNAGFNVIRFDARNHVGLSSGEIRNFTLSSLLQDVHLAAQALHRCGFERLTLLCISLSAPVTLKYAIGRTDLNGIVSVIGAVDTDFAVCKATGLLTIEPYRLKTAGRPVFQTIFGYKVSADEFVNDMDDAGFAPLERIVEAVSKVRCPVHTVMAAEDDWVPADRLLRVHEAAPKGSTLTIFEGVTHEFGRSVQTAKRVCLEVCRLVGLTLDDAQHEWKVPNFAEILHANTVEASCLDGLSAVPLNLEAASALEVLS